MQSMTELEHGKGIYSAEEDLYRAHMALMAGQPHIYKARLQSAFISIQQLMRQEVR